MHADRETSTLKGRWRIGEWTLDVERDTLSRDDESGARETVKIEPRLTRLLIVLASRSGEIVSAEELLSSVWRDVVVTPDSVYQSIAKLRRALHDDPVAPRCIETLPRKGYRLLLTAQALPYMRRVSDPPTVPPAAPLADAVAATSTPTPMSVAAPAAEQTDANRQQAEASLATRNRSRRRLWLAAVGVLATGAVVGVAIRILSASPEQEAVRTAARALGVAVLPFTDGSASGADAVFVGGMQREVDSALQPMATLQVAAGGSVRVLADSGAKPSDYAARLNVDYLLRAEVARSRDRVLIRAELIETRTGNPAWGEAFDRPLEQASTLPAEVARWVTQKLNAIPGTGPPKFATSASFRAYEAFLNGTYHLGRATPEDIAKARDALQRAIDLDPAFSRAYSAMALAWMAEYNFGGLALREAVARAQPLLELALRLDADSETAHAVQGFVLLEQMQLERAETHIARALELNPNFSAALLWHGMVATYDGRVRDASTRYARAGQVDPLNFILQSMLASQAILAGSYGTADEHVAILSKLRPGHPNEHWIRANAKYARGDLDGAIEHLVLALKVNPKRFDLWRQLAWLYVDRGDTVRAADAFAQAAKLQPKLGHLQAEAVAVSARSGDRKALAAAIDKPGNPHVSANHAMAVLGVFDAAAGRHERALRFARDAAGRLDADPVRFHGPFSVFLGEFLLVDLAAILLASPGATASDHVVAERYLKFAADYLAHLQRHGNVMHGLHLQKARVVALLGDHAAALGELEAAARLGSKRGWWLQLDPAFVSMRGDAKFVAVAAAMTVAPVPVAGSAAAKQTRPQPQVLWVDDQPENNARERVALESFGARVTAATSTAQALRLSQGTVFDLVISDMSRPTDRTAGYALLAALRERGVMTPFIIYTRSCDPAERNDAISRGALTCVDKASELMASALSAVERRQASAAPR